MNSSIPVRRFVSLLLAGAGACYLLAPTSIASANEPSSAVLTSQSPRPSFSYTSLQFDDAEGLEADGWVAIIRPKVQLSWPDAPVGVEGETSPALPVVGVEVADKASGVAYCETTLASEASDLPATFAPAAGDECYSWPQGDWDYWRPHVVISGTKVLGSLRRFKVPRKRRYGAIPTNSFTDVAARAMSLADGSSITSEDVSCRVWRSMSQYPRRGFKCTSEAGSGWAAYGVAWVDKYGIIDYRKVAVGTYSDRIWQYTESLNPKKMRYRTSFRRLE